MNMTVNPQSRIIGDISLPGDKSISHRAALLAALSGGVSCLRNYPEGRDCRTTLKVLAQLGIEYDEQEPGTVRIFGCNGNFSAPMQILDCENSGTTARLLIGLLAGQNFDATIDGDASLRRRPMEPVAASLRQMGATIFTSGPDKNLPITVSGGKLTARSISLPAASAQVKGAILFAGLQAEGTTSISENLSTRDHTERAMRLAGINLETHGSTVTMAGGQTPRPFDISIPGDISSAAFWMALAAPNAGSRMIVRNVALNRRRLGFVNALLQMGAAVYEEVISRDDGEWFGNLDIRGGPMRPIQIEAADIPSLIDEIPLLAVLAAKANGVSTIRDAACLREKECDRISAVVTNLTSMGVDVEELEDGMVIRGNGRLQAAKMNSFGDHRIAMAFAIAGLLADDGVSIIENAGCIEISYPEFQRDLTTLLEKNSSAARELPSCSSVGTP